MADYAIGDVQGCYDELQLLLEHINFDEKVDCLWFVGDLVNRGLKSLEVLRFIKALPIRPKITLGNHDLHLLSLIFTKKPYRSPDDTLRAVLNAPDVEELGHWLRKQSLLYYCPKLDVVMCHAGIAPCWDLNQAMGFAKELEAVLGGDNFQDFLEKMYGNKPNKWSDDLTGIDRLRIITNYFTRMRYCDEQGRLNLDYKGPIKSAPSNLIPWYLVPNRKEIKPHLVFGHWAALMGQSPHPRIHAIDTGCIWGGGMTALRLQDMKRFLI